MGNSKTQQNGALITENVRVRRYDVDSNNDGWRLDRYLTQCMPRISRSLAGRIARDGDVEVIPRRKIKAGTRLRNGDVVIVRHELAPERVQDAQVEIIYRDKALIVVGKPSGMLVHESSSVRLNTIQKYLERAGFEQGEPVHRLDRETSGVLICAGRRDLVPQMRGLFATAHPQKIYRALVLDPDGQWRVGERRCIETPLGTDPSSRLEVKMGVGTLEARTYVEVMGRVEHAFGPMADLRVRIETGRQHQIRIHLAMQGTPIAGDKLYSLDDAFFMAIHDSPEDPELLARLPFNRHALHAWRLSMPHPDSGERVEFEAALPEIWNASSDC